MLYGIIFSIKFNGERVGFVSEVAVELVSRVAAVIGALGQAKRVGDVESFDISAVNIFRAIMVVRICGHRSRGKLQKGEEVKEAQ